jgi:6-phosphogluconolactonase
MTDVSYPFHSTARRLYVGTHRKAHRAEAVDTAHGIYIWDVRADGAPTSHGLAETLQPGWIAFAPSGRHLYAANEVRAMDGRDGGAVTAFCIDPKTGAPAPLNTAPLPPMPCHCTVDATGRYLVVATFGGGTVHLFRIEEDGRIGEEADQHAHHGSSQHPQRQTHPHAHAVQLSPDQRFLLVPDLGTDRLMVYGFDANAGRLHPCPDRHVNLPALSGPRHVTFGPEGHRLYLVNEMSATITVLSWDAADAAMRPLQTVDLLPEGFEGLRSGAAIVVHPQGERLFATARSHGSSGMPAMPGLDLLVEFSIDRESGLLALIGRQPSGGGIPRSIVLSPDARHLYVGHQCSGTVVEFAITASGAMPTGRVIVTPVPVCLTFAP